MSLELCICTQGVVMCYQIICMRKHNGIHCISHQLCGSIATDNSICGWFTITFLSLAFPPMQICKGLTQAPPDYLTCQPGKLSQHGKRKREQTALSERLAKLSFPMG